MPHAAATCKQSMIRGVYTKSEERGPASTILERRRGGRLSVHQKTLLSLFFLSRVLPELPMKGG